MIATPALLRRVDEELVAARLFLAEALTPANMDDLVQLVIRAKDRTDAALRILHELTTD